MEISEIISRLKNASKALINHNLYEFIINIEGLMDVFDVSAIYKKIFRDDGENYQLYSSVAKVLMTLDSSNKDAEELKDIIDELGFRHRVLSSYYEFGPKDEKIKKEIITDLDFFYKKYQEILKKHISNDQFQALVGNIKFDLTLKLELNQLEKLVEEKCLELEEDCNFIENFAKKITDDGDRYHIQLNNDQNETKKIAKWEDFKNLFSENIGSQIKSILERNNETSNKLQENLNNFLQKRQKLDYLTNAVEMFFEKIFAHIKADLKADGIIEKLSKIKWFTVIPDYLKYCREIAQGESDPYQYWLITKIKQLNVNLDFYFEMMGIFTDEIKPPMADNQKREIIHLNNLPTKSTFSERKETAELAEYIVSMSVFNQMAASYFIKTFSVEKSGFMPTKIESVDFHQSRTEDKSNLLELQFSKAGKTNRFFRKLLQLKIDSLESYQLYIRKIIQLHGNFNPEMYSKEIAELEIFFNDLHSQQVEKIRENSSNESKEKVQWALLNLFHVPSFQEMARDFESKQNWNEVFNYTVLIHLQSDKNDFVLDIKKYLEDELKSVDAKPSVYWEKLKSIALVSCDPDLCYRIALALMYEYQKELWIKYGPLPEYDDLNFEKIEELFGPFKENYLFFKDSNVLAKENLQKKNEKLKTISQYFSLARQFGEPTVGKLADKMKKFCDNLQTYIADPKLYWQLVNMNEKFQKRQFTKVISQSNLNANVDPAKSSQPPKVENSKIFRKSFRLFGSASHEKSTSKEGKELSKKEKKQSGIFKFGKFGKRLSMAPVSDAPIEAEKEEPKKQSSPSSTNSTQGIVSESKETRPREWRKSLPPVDPPKFKRESGSTQEEEQKDSIKKLFK